MREERDARFLLIKNGRGTKVMTCDVGDISSTAGPNANGVASRAYAQGRSVENKRGSEGDETV